jgi:hypothetical protein
MRGHNRDHGRLVFDRSLIGNVGSLRGLPNLAQNLDLGG